MVDQGFVVHRPRFMDENGQRSTEAEFFHRKARFDELGYPAKLKMNFDLLSGSYRSAEYSGTAGLNRMPAEQ
jgi:twinkle protein